LSALRVATVPTEALIPIPNLVVLTTGQVRLDPEACPMSEKPDGLMGLMGISDKMRDEWEEY
jgi:hypothetical protein